MWAERDLAATGSGPAPAPTPGLRAGPEADVTVRRQGARDGCYFSRGQFHGALHPRSGVGVEHGRETEPPRGGDAVRVLQNTARLWARLSQTRVESTLRGAGCSPAPRQRELLASSRTVVPGGARSPGNETVRAHVPCREEPRFKNPQEFTGCCDTNSVLDTNPRLLLSQ